MRIQEHEERVIIEDSPAALAISRLIAGVICLTFLFKAIDELTACLSGHPYDLQSMLVASFGFIFAAIICAVVLSTRSIIVLDRADRELILERRRLQGAQIDHIPFRDIKEVTVSTSADGEDYGIDLHKRTGGTIRLTSTLKSLYKAQEIAATIEEVSRT